MTTPEDVEYRLDAEHIRRICQAVCRPNATVNVTHIDHPSRVQVDVAHHYRAAEYLRRVGYLTEITARTDGLVVTGWSTPHLATRIAALNGILTRCQDTVAHTAACAIDIYALTNGDWVTDAGRYYAVRAAGGLLRHEAELITGPYAEHEPRIRPIDDDQARLIDRNQRLETAIRDQFDRAERVAAYAVAAYAEDSNAQDEPENARSRAIAHAMATYSQDIHRGPVEGRAAVHSASGSSGRDHPAVIAAADQPETGLAADDQTAGESTTVSRPAGPATECPPKTTPNRGSS